MDMIVDIQHGWVPVESSPGMLYRYPQTISEYMKEKYACLAVYRWAVYRGDGHEPYMVYVGEAENLVRRLQDYLRGTKPTAKRIKSRLDLVLEKGSRIEIHCLEFQPFHLLIDKARDEHELIALHRLSNLFVRKMMENIGVLLHDARYCKILNKAPNPMERRRDRAQKRLAGSTNREKIDFDPTLPSIPE